MIHPLNTQLQTSKCYNSKIIANYDKHPGTVTYIIQIGLNSNNTKK